MIIFSGTSRRNLLLHTLVSYKIREKILKKGVFRPNSDKQDKLEDVIFV